MLGKQAKILAPLDVADLLVFADCSRQPLRNRVIVLLSAKAGLRAGEIASLTWDMVLDASGQIGKCIELRERAAKKGSGRLIPMHPDLAGALSILRQASNEWLGHVVRSERGGPMTALSIVVWFKRAYALPWTGRLLVPFRAPHLHHPSGPPGLRSGRLITRRSTASRASTAIPMPSASSYR
jgi:integrase